MTDRTPHPARNEWPPRAALPILLALSVLGATAFAQPGVEQQQQAAQDTRLTEAVPASEIAALTYTNRFIVLLRARVLARTPVERARAAEAALDELVANNVSGPVSTRTVSGLVFVRVADRDVLALVPADVDVVTGETLDGKASATAANLTLALTEAIELRTPGRLASEAARVVGATVLFALVVALLRNARRRVRARLVGETQRRLGRSLPGQSGREEIATVSRLVSGMVTFVNMTVTVLATYALFTFSLRQFPYSRPWGETLRARLLELLGRIALSIVAALPGLFVLLVIMGIARVLVHLANAFFTNVERGAVQVGWAYPETAAATRRLVALTLWLFAVILAYPYLPGSGSDAFRGVSVLVGLIVSFGSSGIVNQMMSGLTLTYARALRVGDAVRISDHEGIVTGLGLLSVRLRTFQGEEITLPNAVVVGQGTTNYTRLAPAGGMFLATGVTIGYDTPWRQVRALLLLAAERTSNVRRDPAPRVFQDALEDYYPSYRLLVCLEDATARDVTRDRLHANIQDAFNEFGVQIMSPHYRMDPSSAKVVPKARWHEAPAAEKDGPDAAASPRHLLRPES